MRSKEDCWTGKKEKMKRKFFFYADFFLASGALISFIGSPQQIKSHGLQPHAWSTTITTPH
jgi:hypothetical protein